MEENGNSVINVDAEFISALLLAEKKPFLNALKDVQDEELQGLEQRAYFFIKEYYKKYKEQPTKIIVIRKFPKLKFYKSNAPLEYYIDELHDRKDYETLTEHSAKIQTALLNQNIVEVKGLYQQAMEKVAKTHLSATVTLKSGFADRIGLYQEAKANKGIIGLQTGVKRLDAHIGGIQDEMFIVMGKRGTGKTFFLLLLLKAFISQDVKGVAFVSNEMSPIKIGTRLDAMFAEISYSRYRKGLSTVSEEKRIASLLKLYKKVPPIYIISGVGKSAEQIGYELAALDIGVFFVDGLYLQSQGFPDPFNNTLSASRAYQQIIKVLGVPGIISTQATKEDETKYARAIEEDADMVCMMKQSQAMKDDETMQFEFTKIREEDSDFRFWLNWVFDRWDFSETDYTVPDTFSEQSFD